MHLSMREWDSWIVNASLPRPGSIVGWCRRPRSAFIYALAWPTAFQRVLAAAVARAWRYRGQDVSRHYARARAFHDHLRLAHRQHGLDVHAVLCRARRVGGPVGRMARTRRPAQSRRRCGVLLGGRPRARRHRHLRPPTMADVARLRRDRRHRAWSRLHLAGVDAWSNGFPTGAAWRPAWPSWASAAAR